MKKNAKKKDATYVYKPSTLDILRSLMAEPQWLDLMKDKHSEYLRLIKRIQEIAADDEYGELSIKNLADDTGFKTAAVTRTIHAVYEGIWALNDEQPELFEQPGIKYSLRFVDRFQKESAYFTLWLEHPLRYGDSFRWAFVNAKQQTYFYYVDQIDHEFIYGKQILGATLRSGPLNSYRKMLHDKAVLLDLIGLGESFELTDHELEHLLIHRVEQNRNGYPESLSYMRSRKFYF